MARLLFTVTSTSTGLLRWWLKVLFMFHRYELRAVGAPTLSTYQNCFRFFQAAGQRLQARYAQEPLAAVKEPSAEMKINPHVESLCRTDRSVGFSIAFQIKWAIVAVAFADHLPVTGHHLGKIQCLGVLGFSQGKAIEKAGFVEGVGIA